MMKPLIVVVAVAWMVSALLPHVAAKKSCFEDPSQAFCNAFTMNASKATSDVATICASRSTHIGCTVMAHCLSGDVSGIYCDPVSILGDLCHKDGDSHSTQGCADYNGMCAENSVVMQCTAKEPIPNVPTTEDAVNANLMMCGMMKMDNCDTCTSAQACPDPLLTLSELCLAMPMSDCKQWSAMCDSANPAGFELYCGSSGTHELPQMLMYFHFGTREYFLLSDLVSNNVWGFLLGNAVVFLLALGLTYIKVNRAENERLWATVGRAPGYTELAQPLNGGSGARETRAVSFDPSRNASRTKNGLRAVYTLVISTLDFMLMLVVMTFNLYILASVVLGLALGQLLWGHHLAEDVANGNPAAQEGCC